MIDEDDPDETEPDDEGPLQYRDGDGEWLKIQVAPKRTGDPELDAIWAMSFRQLQDLLDNESHPLHAKAVQVAAEMVQPIRDAANQALAPLTESLLKAVDAAKLSTEISSKLDGLTRPFGASWLARLIHESPTYKSSLPLETFAPVHVERPSASALGSFREIDFDSPAAPDASVVEIHEAAEIRAHEMRVKQNELLTDLVAEFRENSKSGARALKFSEDALAAAKSSKRAGWTAAWAAIAAAVIGVAGIIVTVILASL